MLVFVISIDGCRYILDITEGTLVSELRKMIQTFVPLDRSNKLFYQQKELKDYDIIDHNILGWNPTITIYNNLSISSHNDEKIPSIGINRSHLLNDSFHAFISKCSKQPQFEEMIRLIRNIPIEQTNQNILMINQRIEKKQIDISQAPALFIAVTSEILSQVYEINE